MKIAYISFEYPPDTALGGIATYIYEAARMMAARGHQVEVFCASPSRTISEKVDGVAVNRIGCDDRRAFPSAIVAVFAMRHEAVGFDVMESPEFSGDGLYVKKAFPQLPLVVKLQTPWYLIDELNNHYFRFYNKARYIVGGWLKGQWRSRFWHYKDIHLDPDYQITHLANQVQSPSVSLGNLVAQKWHINRSTIINLPTPFIPRQNMLDIAPDTHTRVVSFIGRLERRKGLIELAKALPYVFEKVPDFKMRFVGKDFTSHIGGLTMRQYLEKVLRKYKHRVEFGQFASDDIYKAYAGTDICIFPSLWENFPNVCLEAMSAARGVIGSKFGGMSDMIEDGTSGLLIDPFHHRQLGDALIRLLTDDGLRIRLGKGARERVLNNYNTEVIGALMEKYYLMAIHQLKTEEV